MTADSRALQALKLRAKQGDRSVLQELRERGYFQQKRIEQAGYALSHAQRRLWVLYQMDSSTPAYNVLGALRLAGSLDTVTLRAALQALDARHEALRTTFRPVNGEPRQFVQTAGALPFETLDLTAAADPVRAARLIADRDASTPFDLQQGPLRRVKLLHLAAEDHVLLFNIHHIVCDAWSLGVLTHELMELYAAFAQEKSNPLAPLRIQYKDYAAWQNEQLASEAARPHRDYWLNKLVGELPVLDLPADFPRPPMLTYDGATVSRPLDDTVVAPLLELGPANDASLFMTLTALVKVLLYRYSGQSDILIGAPVAGREHPDAEGQVGFYVNMLALRDTLFGAENFLAVQEKVKQTVGAAFAHQSCPFDRLVDELDLARDMSRAPLFDVLVALQNDARLDFHLGDVRVSDFDVDFQIAKFDLTFWFVETDKGLRLDLNYNTNLFRAATVQRMAVHFGQLLASVLAKPEAPIYSHEILTAGEKQQLLVEFNATVADYPHDKTLAQLFEAQVERASDNVAVVFGDTELSYDALNARANAVAWQLQAAHALQPGEPVGLLLDPSDWVVAGILGILKAGGVYVPIDPTYPEARIRYMLTDSGCRVVLSESQYLALAERCLPEQPTVPLVDIRTLPAKSYPNPTPQGDSDQLAYIIYTSGSTGQPKGCLITQRNVVRLLLNERHNFDFNADDVWVVAHSFSFDFSVWEMYGALMYGGRVVVARREEVRDVERFHALIKRQRVTVLNQTPAAFYNLIAQEERVETHALDAHLRYIIFGGDRLEPTYLRPWVQRYPLDRVRLINMYGITETTVHVTFCRLTDADIWGAAGRNPIGAPLPETSVYVLNEALEPQPAGVVGELYVGGSGVCRGYLNRPELTTARFISNPFVQGERLYRTGDLGRWMPDGALEHLGRNDDQVQLRGYRIELGEIEAALNEHPGVEKSVVIARGDAPSDRRLVAYLTPHPDRAVSVRQALRLQREGQLAPEALYKLPNGLVVAHLNKSETDFVYAEVFQKQSYLQHGITLDDGDCVFDVGANIGLFTLFAAQRCRNLSIYAFEPIPPVFELLRLNVALYDLDVKLFALGVSDRAGSATFTYYPHVSIISGRLADEAEESRVIKSFIRRENAPPDELLDELLADRLQQQKIACPMTTLSNVIQEQGVEQIDLLKIDVEKSEQAVLTGIQAADWPKIRQLVVEVDAGQDGRLEHIETLLRRRGFDVTSEQDAQLVDSGLFNVYARRGAAARRWGAPQRHTDAQDGAPPKAWHSAGALTQAVRQFLQRRLPEYMTPTDFVLLDVFPITANRKIDRKALPAPETTAGAARSAPVAPRNDMEHALVNIWTTVLGSGPIGVHDNFFELGGHSLKALQVVSRLHSQLDVKIGLSDLFQAPTVAGLAEAARRAAPGAYVQISLAPAAAHYAVSPAQRRLWVLDRMEALGAAYNIPALTLLDGALHIDALRQALTALVDRHEALRTTFMEVDGEPRQRIHQSAADIGFRLEVTDLREAANPIRRARTRALREIEIPFDLGRAPLLRARLYHLAEQRYLFLLTMHHIVSDGWSMDVLVRELLALYQAFAEGNANPLPPLRIQYKDYAHWQNERLARTEADRQRAYWVARLSGEIPVLALPTDQPRPALQSFRGAAHEFVLERAATQALFELGRAHGATGFMTLLALVKTLLYRYTGQEDLIVGSPVAGREHADLEGQVGFYINMLALRDNIQGSDSFERVLERVRDSVTTAFEHQNYPFDRLVEELDLQRDMGRSPLFDVAVTLQNAPDPISQLPNLGTTLIELPTSSSKFDLTFFFTELETGDLHALIEYSTDLFQPARIERLAGHFQELAASVRRDPDESVSRLNMLPAWERRKVVAEFNAMRSEYPREQTIAAVFENWVARAPENVAVQQGETALTYRELNARANRVARYLRQQCNLQPEGHVGVLLDRSEWTAVALLGILKAGGAYLPLDPKTPQPRTAYMLRDAECDTVLSEPQHIAGLLAGAPGAVDIRAIAAEDASNPPPVGDGDSRAYVIYTSGSTGQPKGALIAQRSVLRLVLNTNYIAIQETDRILQTGSLAFDASTFEIWGALLNGACVCFPDEETLLKPDALGKVIQKHGVTIIFLTTGLYNQLVEADIEIFRGLRALLTGGEKVSVRQINKVRQAHAALTILHVYGPTENTTFSTYYPVTQTHEWDVPIGFPLANSTIYILDQDGAPAPIGVPGEICTGGDGVARGYLNQPALNSERFGADPFLEGGRLYHTGDLGLWLPDGAVKFIGRLDNQLKVRGFRVEPGEVEHRLLAHPAVTEAIVIGRKTAAGGQELIAYFAAEQELSAAALRAHVIAALPDYMVPAYFVQLEQLPIKVMGKVDRQALPAPETAALAIGSPYQAPQSETESLLADVWQAVLNREQIGVHDNYFNLGGDSIIAIQLTSRLREMGWKLQIQDLFQTPTIAQLAPRLERVGQSARREAVTGPVPLTPVQRWFFEMHTGEIQHFNQVVLLRANERLDASALRAALYRLHEHHDALRMTYHVQDDQITQTSQGLEQPFGFEVVELQAAAHLTAHAETVQRSIDLENGPLLKSVLYQLPDSDRLLLVCHHLVVDGVSWRILLADLERGYGQARAGAAIDFGPRPPSYQEWAEALGQYALQADFTLVKDYWSVGTAGDSNSVSPAEGANAYGESRSVGTRLSVAETEALRTRTHHAYNTQMNDVLLAALGRALGNWSSEQTTWITLEGHGRESLPGVSDVSRTVGWFTSLYPFQLPPVGADIGVQLKQVKEALRRIPRKGVEYGILKYLAAPEQRAGLPLNFQPAISFNYLGQFEAGAQDGLFAFAEELTGEPVSPTLARQHELDITGALLQGQLQLTIVYNPGRQSLDRVEALLTDFKAQLLQVIEHCRNKADGEKTPADFTYSDLSLEEFKSILDKLS